MILFLDFDGVLHPISSRIFRREGSAIVIEQAPDGEPLFCRMPILAAVLRDYPKVKIVLSTSWVRYMPRAALLEPLGDLADRIIGSPREIPLPDSSLVTLQVSGREDHRWADNNYCQSGAKAWHSKPF